MKKALVLNGSPKAASDTMMLTNAFLKGLTENGEYGAEIIDVIRKDIRPCRGCLQCWENADGRCVQQDDQNAILEKYAAADVILYSFPLYCYAMPSHLKAVLDRTIPLLCGRMVKQGDMIRHVPIVDFSGKKTVVISGCGFPNWENNFKGLRIMCRNCFVDPTMIFVPEAPMMHVEEARIAAEPLLEKFERAGGEFARCGGISGETIRELETPMIPAELYIAKVNGTA